MIALLRSCTLLTLLVAVGGCATRPVPMTIGEIPRDGRGLPVWSEVMKKVPPGAMTSGAGRAEPASAR